MNIEARFITGFIAYDGNRNVLEEWVRLKGMFIPSKDYFPDGKHGTEHSFEEVRSFIKDPRVKTYDVRVKV